MQTQAAKTTWLPPKIALAALFFVAMAGAVYWLPLEQYLQALLESIQQFGAWGVIALGLLFIPACVLLVPGSIMTLSTGFLAAAHWQNQPLLALAVGVATVSLGSTGGAATAFLLGRSIARDWTARRIARHPHFKALDEAIALHGIKLTALLRMSPLLPFNLLNYAMGLTSLRFRDFVLGSWLGMLPLITFFVYLGATAQEMAQVLASGRTKSSAEYALLALGLAATFVVAYLLSRQARKRYLALTGQGTAATDEAADKQQDSQAMS